MASTITIGAVVLLLAAAILRFTELKRWGGLLLIVLPAIACIAGAVELAHGTRYLGQGAYRNDLKAMGWGLALMLLTVAAGFRWRVHWLFWTAWVLNAAICAVMVYLAFFWKVFS